MLEYSLNVPSFVCLPGSWQQHPWPVWNERRQFQGGEGSRDGILQHQVSAIKLQYVVDIIYFTAACLGKEQNNNEANDNGRPEPKPKALVLHAALLLLRLDLRTAQGTGVPTELVKTLPGQSH